jgi:DNA-binding HxlR family transcriptional regulator
MQSPIGHLIDNRFPASITNHDELLQLLERRWAMVIIARLCRHPLRFSELQRAIPGMSPRMMMLRLHELEHHGIVERVAFPEVSTREKYTLTASGQALRPAVNALLEWTMSRPLPAGPRPLAEFGSGGGHEMYDNDAYATESRAYSD